MKQDFHPDFISRYQNLFSESEFADFLKYCQLPLRKAIRVNTSKISLDSFEKLAKNNKWILKKIPYVDSGYFIDREDRAIPLGKSLEYFAGLFYIQETSSMIPPMVLAPKSGEIILDISAAPGSKTTQMANYIDNVGLVIGNDIVASRLKALKTNINYQGLISCASSKFDGRDFGRYFKETFDKILLDAPCSGEGTMRKDQVKWSLEVINELSILQKKLIMSAIEALKVGGILVYSTCTMTPEEDEIVLDHAKKELGDSIEIVPWELPNLQSTPGILEWQGNELDNECQNGQKIWPHINDTEGFFIAKIIKKKQTNIFKTLEYYPKKNEEVILKGKELKILFSIIKKRFGINKDVFSDYIIVKKENNLEIRTKQSNSFSSLPLMQNIGLPLGLFENGKFSFDFYSSQVFGKFADKNTVNLINKEQTETYRTGGVLNLDKNQIKNCSIGQVIIKYNNIILGSSLLQENGKLKNQVPRETIKI